MTGTLARLGPLVPRMPDSPKQRIAEDGLMFRCLVGSGVHGTAIGGQDDRDEMGVTVEPEPYILGHREFGHYQYRTQPEGECSGPGDLDLIVYGLRKYVALTVAGNPTVLTTLFTQDDHVEYADEFGAELRAQRDMFLSRRAVPKFLGYLRSQRDGLLGLRSGGTNNKGRASIRAKYSFDTKFAGHMVRLGVQGLELVTTGRITLPIPEPDLTWIRELRVGEHTLAEALDRAQALHEAIDAANTDRSPLPAVPDMDVVDRWVTSVYMRSWGYSL